jgi:hypothetical protein
MLWLKWLEPQSTITQIANMKPKARAASILRSSGAGDSGKVFLSFYDTPARAAMAIERAGDAL